MFTVDNLVIFESSREAHVILSKSPDSAGKEILTVPNGSLGVLVTTTPAFINQLETRTYYSKRYPLPS